MGAVQGLEIRLWRPEDRLRIKELVWAYLEEQPHGDFLADEHNAEAMTDLGLAWAAAGEPSLVASLNGELVAFTLWGPITSPLHLRHRVLHGIGTYVAPKHRRNRLAVSLRQEATEMARARGYERIDGTAFDQRGWQSAKAAGFDVVGYILRKQLVHSEERAA